MAEVVWLTWSPRVAPAQLSWPAWQAVHAVPVLTATPDHPLAPGLAAAGVRVEVIANSADLQGRGRCVWLPGPDGEPALRATLGDAVTEVAGHVELPGSRLLDAVAVMDRLRSPGGCPWDADQTHDSLTRYLVEESYEVLDALATGDREGLREELGDLLLQVLFHARIAAEHVDDPWTVDEVAAELVDKLVRRHPHVFARTDEGAGPSTDTAATEVRWEELKRTEKGRRSPADGVPRSQPALALAGQLLRRAERAGVQVSTDDPVRLVEGLSALTDDGPGRGALLAEALLAVVALGGHHVDPEPALRARALRLADELDACSASQSAASGIPADPSRNRRVG